MMRTPSSRVMALTLCAGMLSAYPAQAGPVEMPNRKPGLWEIKVNAGAQMPAMTMQQCTDATTDKDMAASFSPMAKDMCSKQDMQKTATGLVIDATCTVGGTTSVSRTEINGDFNSAYTVKVSTKGDGKLPESVTMMDAKWLGACKADQKAGDIVMPGGMKMNIKDMQGMAPKQ
ncbi:MAG: DUF3617 family protein [Afipia sp.]|nr:DUF3617 family protein [Afipia sp.]